MDLMIDLETLGTAPGCVILSIGARVFDLATGQLHGSFYYTLDVAEQEAMGLRVDQDTLNWWKSQKPEAWAAATEDPAPVLSALRCFEDWVHSKGVGTVWCQGQDFDFPILAHLQRRLFLTPPWKFYEQRDTRSVYDVAQRITGFDSKAVPRAGTHHNALDDCDHQIACLVAAYNTLAMARMGGQLLPTGV